MTRCLRIALVVFVACSAAYSKADDQRRWSPSELLAAAASVRIGVAGEAAVAGDRSEPQKCGVWLGLAVRENWQQFSTSERERLSSFLSAPQRQKARVMGHFLVHYDTSGADAAAMLDVNGLPVPNSAEEYVDSVGFFFNDVFDREVTSLGYDSPLQPGQETFDVYVSNIGFYGLTQPLTVIGGFTPPRYTSYIEIDNNYRGFPSEGMAGLKVTAAHEFHHAIQFASYGYWSGEQYFMEITSTWMEDVMFDAVNDYYNYVKDLRTGAPKGQFATPELSFSASNMIVEYSRAIWGKYIEQRFGADVMRRTWEEIRQVATLSALDRALAERQSSLREAFLEWSTWNLRTGVNADTVSSYREGAAYPAMRLRPGYTYLSPSGFVADSIQAYSSVYHPVTVNDRQMLVIISNVNRRLPAGFLKFTYEIQDNDASGYKRLSNGISVRVGAADPENWISQEDVPTIVSEVATYPNPFVRGRSPAVTFRLPITVSGGPVSLFIMSAGLDKVFSGDLPVLQPRLLEQTIRWDGRDDDGRDVPSGVYIFVLKVDGREFSGKISVIGG